MKQAGRCPWPGLFLEHVVDWRGHGEDLLGIDFEHRSEFAAGAGDERADGPNGDAERPRDLLVAEPVEVVQRQRHAIPRRESLEGGEHALAEFHLLEPLER